MAPKQAGNIQRLDYAGELRHDAPLCSSDDKVKRQFCGVSAGKSMGNDHTDFMLRTGTGSERAGGKGG
ncbi:hypothetical protein VTK26DRAFT_2919 [Humicola hyalothermophila]